MANVDLTSPIGKRWVALGGSAGIGDPLGPVAGSAGSGERYQRFPGGVLCYHGAGLSAPALAWLVEARLFDKWLAVWSSRDLPGRPSADSFPLKFGGAAAPIDGGVVVMSPGGDCWVVAGGVFARYQQLVNLNQAAKPPFGFPLGDSDEQLGVQPFEGGTLWESSDRATAWIVGDAALNKGVSTPAIGRPAGDTFALKGGAEATRFDRGVVVDTPGQPPVAVQPPMYERYAALVELDTAPHASLGLPLADADQAKSFQVFENGALFWSPGHGTVLMDPRVLEKWRSPYMAGQNFLGEHLQDYIGRPTDDSFATTEGGAASYFERGMIVARSDGRAFEVHGAIYERYRVLVGQGKASRLGLPESDEYLPGNGGRASRFQHGEIYWHLDHGAWEIVDGPIRTRYNAIGGPLGRLRYPIGPYERVMSGQRLVGMMMRFAGMPAGEFDPGEGRIYHSEKGVWEVSGAVLGAWLDVGGPMSPIGLPTRGRQPTPTQAPGAYSEFENGIGVFVDGHQPLVTKGLNLRLLSLHSGEKFKVQYRLKVSRRGAESEDVGTWPPNGQFESGGIQGTDDVLTIRRLSIGDTIGVWLNGIHERWWPQKDERLGTIDVTFSAENLWGIDAPTHTYSAPKFDASVRAVPTPTFELDPAQFVTQAFWPFHNFGTQDLGWELFAETFTDVSEDEEPTWPPPLFQWPKPFKWTFWDRFYRESAQTGNCFGMCAEAIHAQFNSSPFLEPIYSNRFNAYRTDQQSLDPAHTVGDREAGHVINVKHGYQLGAKSVSWGLGMYQLGLFQNPKFAYLLSRQEWEAGRPSILSVSKDSPLSQHGHTVIPFKWDDKTAPPLLTMYVADPNNPGNVSRIDVTGANDFEFWHAGSGTIWRGGTNHGGRLFCMPLQTWFDQPTLPLEGWWSSFDGSALLFINGDADTEQIQDSEGRTLYQSAPRGMPRYPNHDPVSRMPGIVHVPVHARSDAATDAPPRGAGNQRGLYYVRRASGVEREAASGTDTTEILHQIAMPHPGTYVWGYASATLTITLHAETVPNAADLIRLHDFALGTQVASFEASRDGGKVRNFAIAVHGWSPRETPVRWFRLSNLQLEPGHTLGFHVEDGGRTLAIINHGSDLKADLGLHRGLEQAAQTNRVNVPLASGEVTRLRPLDWSRSHLHATPVRLTRSTTLTSAVRHTRMI